MKLYPNNGGYFCFGCGAHGSVIDFVAQLFGLDVMGAVRRLNQDFNLHLPLDRPPSPQERQRADVEARRRRRIGETKEAFESWRAVTLDKLNSCYRKGHTALLMLETEADVGRLTAEEILAVRSMAFLEYTADTLTYGSTEEQMQVLGMRREVDVLCKRILESNLKTMPTQLIAS